jgi:hypothetical protein
MRSGKFLIIFGASLFVAGVLAVCFFPLLVAGGLRLWAGRVGRQGGLRIELGQIEAPFLGPVVFHNVQISSDSAALFQVNAATPRLEADLNLAAMFGASDNRMLRTLRSETISIDVRRNPQSPAASQRLAWPLFADLLADNFRLSGVRLHVENGATIVDFHDGMLSGSELESGVFTAREIEIESPWFRKSFSNLRGATSWQEGRFVIGALTVMPGLDLDTITIDLAHLAESRLAMEVGLDAFGGKIRARLSSDDHDDKRTWDVAGSCSEISVAQMSDALEWTNRASGSLHASKFTFRGELNDLGNATAALWAEVTGLTWRDRTADTVMIGASLYNREVQVEQLYIKQRNNQLTLNGEFALPEKAADWLKPAFRGDVSASINDLGDFARLFGWSASDFSGKIAVQGSVTVREQKLAGRLAASGNSLVLFRSPVESLEVNLGLEESRLTITQLELLRKNDFLRGEGNFGLAGDRSYSATFQTSLAEVTDYAGLMPAFLSSWAFGGSLSADWTGSGKVGADSGQFHLRGQKVRPLESSVVPFDAEFEGEYSPDKIFFRQFHLWNQRTDLSSFVTVAKDYLQFQAVQFSLEGKSTLRGEIFLPISVAKIRENASWVEALSPEPGFAIDVALDPLDVTELGAAVNPRATTGQASGRIELYGTPASLQGHAEMHLQGLGFEDAAPLSGDLESRLAAGTLELKANAAAPGSDPVKLEGSMPLRLEKTDGGFALKTDGPLSATLNFPAVFLAKLPGYLSRNVFTRGILSGNLTISNSIAHPNIVGDANLIDAQFLGGASLSAGLSFKGSTGEIDFARLKQNQADISARGEVELSDIADAGFRFSPSTALIESTSLEPGDCVNSVQVFPGGGENQPATPIQQVDVRGGLFGSAWRISLFHESPSGETQGGEGAPRTFPFCDGAEPRGKTLTLQVAPAF